MDGGIMECEICKEHACYYSERWLTQDSILVLYWCKQHAPVGAKYFDDSVKEDDNANV